MLAACLPVQSESPVDTGQPSTPGASTSALDGMASKFAGHYSRQEIQAKLDESFGVYGIQPTEPNYRKAADVLIPLSAKAIGQGCAACTEMAIIELISSRTLPGATWDSAAAMAVDRLALPPPPSGIIPQ